MKSKVIIQGKNFELTIRELVVSILILIIGIAFIFLGCRIIDKKYMDYNDKFIKANIIEDQEMFDYCLNTERGLSSSFAKIEADNFVSFSEVYKDFLYVERIKEEYTMHTSTDSDGNIETYYTWDRVETKSKQVDYIVVNGIKVNMSDVFIKTRKVDLKETEVNLKDYDLDYEGFKSYLYERSGIFHFSGDVRYRYEAMTLDDIYEKGNTSFLCSFENKELHLYEKLYKFYNMTPKELRSDSMKTTDVPKILLSIAVSAIFIIGICVFIYLENNYLNNNKEIN
jgi:hypothetical protein